jgi:thiamine biosynthesis lipoprotein
VFGSGPEGHILDPESGMAAPANWRRVSVIHRSAAIADGLSTASVLHDAGKLRNLVNLFPDAAVRAIDQKGKLLVI